MPSSPELRIASTRAQLGFMIHKNDEIAPDRSAVRSVFFLRAPAWKIVLVMAFFALFAATLHIADPRPAVIVFAWSFAAIVIVGMLFALVGTRVMVDYGKNVLRVDRVFGKVTVMTAHELPLSDVLGFSIERMDVSYGETAAHAWRLAARMRREGGEAIVPIYTGSLRGASGGQTELEALLKPIWSARAKAERS
jgi:hypothetical protein